MPTFLVTDMSCAHCANAITKAIRSIDPHADIEVDLDAQRVTVVGTASEAKILQAIHDAGYSPKKPAF